MFLHPVSGSGYARLAAMLTVISPSSRLRMGSALLGVPVLAIHQWGLSYLLVTPRHNARLHISPYVIDLWFSERRLSYVGPPTADHRGGWKFSLPQSRPTRKYPDFADEQRFARFGICRCARSVRGRRQTNTWHAIDVAVPSPVHQHGGSSGKPSFTRRRVAADSNSKADHRPPVKLIWTYLTSTCRRLITFLRSVVNPPPHVLLLTSLLSSLTPGSMLSHKPKLINHLQGPTTTTTR